MTTATLAGGVAAAGMSPSLTARITERVVSSGSLLARLRSGPALELYYEAGDAHSQLCAALARRLLPRLQIPLQIRLVPAPSAVAYPEEARQRSFAALDAARLAPCHGLPQPVTLTAAQQQTLTARLAAAATPEEFLATEEACLRAVAGGGEIPPGATADPAALLHSNAQRREKLGHYLPAMWQYRGEWFWALDRLEFLQQKLLINGGLRDRQPLSAPDATRLELPKAPAGTPLEFWFSFRSPYSYVAAAELLRRRQRGLHANLQIRPVLPMVMRGLPVPLAKKLYIVRDVKRCADAQHIPFGRVHDPVGQGALRLLTVYPQQADMDTQLRYCVTATQTVWAEGLDACRDDVLRSILERSGLDWPAAQQKLARGIDTAYAEANRNDLFAAGLWGVPCFRCGSFTTWGQDRIWMLDRL